MTALPTSRPLQPASTAPPARPRPWNVTTFPIVGIGGSRGKTTVAFMLADILRAAGMSVGSWTSAGVFLDDVQQEGELQPWSRLLLAARHGEVDVLVQELPSSTVVAAGLPPETLAMAVLTTLCGNTDACLLTQEALLDRRALSSIAAALHPDGTLIIGADDHDLADIGRSREDALFPVALHREQPAIRAALQAGRYAIWMDDRQAFVGNGQDADTSIMDLRDVRATNHGTLLFQMENAMLAAAAALRIGATPEDVSRGLHGWAPRPDRQPAASTLLDIGEATIILDEPRQMQSLRGLVRSLRHVPHRRALCVLGPMQQMLDEDLIDAARTLAEACGLVIIHGMDEAGERLHMVRTGLAQAMTPPFVIPAADELRAIDYLLNTIHPGDMALVLTDAPERALAHLWPAPAISVASTSIAGVVRSVPA